MIIVDASVAVKWVVSESGSDQAAALLNQDRLGAPTLWLSEASNALWAKVMRQQLTAEEARGQAAELADAPVVPIGLPELLPVAMRLALELQHPIYDCFYLSAAMQRDTHVVTADRRFFEKATGQPALADRVKLLNS
jgi:predicted nucleic acid-binding protein